MKKILILIIMLSLFAVSLWAQEFKFDGYINSGVGVVATDNKDIDPYLKAFANDAEHQGYRFRLNGTFSNESKNAGGKFRMQSQTNLSTISSKSTSKSTSTSGYDDNGGDPKVTTTTGTTTDTTTTSSVSGYFSLPYVFGWVGLLENKIVLNAGIVEDGTWSTGDFWLASDSVSNFVGLGSLLKITPVDGLVFGAGAYTMNRLSGSNNNALANLGALGAPIELKKAAYTLHGVYTMKDVFRLGASFRSENLAGGGNTEQTSLVYGDLRYLGVKDLTAVVAGKFDYLGKEKDTTSGDAADIIISETFAYKMDQFTIGINAVQFLYDRKDASDKKIDMNPSLFFNLWGSYAIDKVVPRLDLVYFMGGRSKLAGTNYEGDGKYSSGSNTNGWDRHGFQNIAVAKDAEADVSVFSVKPSVKINMDSRISLEIGDMINYDMGEKEGAYKDSDDPKKKTRLTNAFYVDLKFSF